MQHRRTLTISDEGGVRFTHDAIVAGSDGVQRHPLSAKHISIGDVVPSDIHMYTALPAGCRFHVTDGMKTLFITEEPPQVRTVQWDAEQDRDDLFWTDDLHHERGDGYRRKFNPEQSTFTLAFPYVVKVHKFSAGIYKDCFLFYRTKPLRSIEDTLYVPNLPNVFGAALGYPQVQRLLRQRRHHGTYARRASGGRGACVLGQRVQR